MSLKTTSQRLKSKRHFLAAFSGLYRRYVCIYLTVVVSSYHVATQTFCAFPGVFSKFLSCGKFHC